MMKFEKRWDEGLKTQVCHLIRDKRISAAVKKIFADHPESDFIREESKKMNMEKIETIFTSEDFNRLMVRRRRPQVVFSDQELTEDGFEVKDDTTLNYYENAADFEVETGSSKKPDLKVCLEIVLDDQELLTRLIKNATGNGIWVRWASTLQPVYVKPSRNGDIKVPQPREYEIIVPPQFDELRSFMVAGLNESVVVVQSGEWVKQFYNHEIYQPFSEKILPHHEGFLPMKITVMERSDGPRFDSAGVTLFIVGVCYKGSVKERHVRNMSAMDVDLHDYGFMPSFSEWF